MSQNSQMALTTNEAAGIQDLEAAGVKFLTSKQVQNLLQVSEATISRMIVDRSIASMKVGSSRRIPIAAYKKYVQQAMANG
ncbi:MAG: helix-turn-helix domain-containing protein [Planctomycetota bacterium]